MHKYCSIVTMDETLYLLVNDYKIRLTNRIEKYNIRILL